MSTVVKDLGAVSAYAYAVEKGYTGTEAEFAELMADYAEVGQRAEDAAGSALNSKTAAQTAATTATNKASEATTAAQTATTKAGEAQTSAQTASSKASEASQSASQASGYAQTAETAKTDAQTAKTQAETARDNAVTAKAAAETAQGKAEDAQAAAESVAESIPSDYSQLSEDVSDLKEDLTHFGEISRASDEMCMESYKLRANGTIESSTIFDVRRIPVTAGDTIYAIIQEASYALAYYQFQNTKFASASDASQVIGSVSTTPIHGALTVPAGASWLIYNVLKTDTKSGIYTSDVLKDIEDIKDDVDAIETDITSIENSIDLLEADGTARLDPSIYVHGGLNANNGNIIGGCDYRVASKEYITYDRQIIITPKSGYRTYLLYFSGDTVIGNSGWVTSHISVPANQKFKNIIAKVTEDTSSTADINEFVNALVISTVVSNIKSTVDSLETTNNNVKASYPNVFDKTNTDLILTDKSVNSSGDVTDSVGFSVIKIPVNGIDGKAYNVYLPNSGNTGFVPATTRFAMYDEKDVKISILVNGSDSPAIVNNANCRYLYTAVSTSTITQDKVMILTDTDGVDLQIWDIIPYGEHKVSDAQWLGKAWASYGDSISALNNGNFAGKGWGKYVNYEYGFKKSYGRSVGGQTFKWGTNGGAVTFVRTSDGAYHSRNGDYNLDNYTGVVPAGCTAVRGCMCSWLRIKTMFPASIKDEIDMVFIMAGSNDHYTEGETLSWIDNDTTDTEWASSDEYATYGGDYNISSTIGAVASTVMKFQAWMPNAIIVLGTPLNGNTETNPTAIRPDYTPDEYYKSQYVKTVASIFGIPCIDVFGTCGINMLNAPTYITDGVHPYNADGCGMVGRAVVGGLKSIYPHY